MFKKRDRMTASEFSTFYADARPYHGTYLTLRTTASDALRVAAVAPKKLYRRAVDRNRVRRRLYALLRECVPDESRAYIVVAKDGVLTASTDELREDLTSLLGRMPQTR